MDPQPCSMKKVLLQVWLSLLTMAMLVMGAQLAFIIAKGNQAALAEPRGGPTLSSIHHYDPSRTSTFLYPQGTKYRSSSNRHPWESSSPMCDRCTLALRNDSILFGQDGVYFLYAHVTFTEQSIRGGRGKSVIVTRNATSGKSVRKLAEGSFPAATHGSVWVAKMVRLQEGDSVSINISGDFLTEDTFWGAFQIH
uniref:THD domain-containing protein n=1 Tax=Hippocampus comes TaxID=109280 RepID=A0A3Q2XL75_HIPCM